jgi:hypothetical protein
MKIAGVAQRMNVVGYHHDRKAVNARLASHRGRAQSSGKKRKYKTMVDGLMTMRGTDTLNLSWQFRAGYKN